MTAHPAIYRISYSIYDEVLRPLPQFYFYVEAHSEQLALARLNAYAEAQNINYRSVAVGYTLAAEDLPQEVESAFLSQGIAIRRGGSQSVGEPYAAA